MKPSAELFQLVKSLSKSEKRYFKLSSSLQSGEKNYMKLFDAIELQAEYDEGAIKDKFAGETFINHLPSEKNHLYSLILKSLRGFYADKSAAAILQEQLRNIELLVDRALYKECSKIIRKAKKMAYQGMAYRTVAEELEANPTQFIAQKIKWDKVIFVGFNALNKAEEVLIAELKKAQKCEILFDADNYYLEDKMQESGAFLRKMKQKDIFEPFNWITNKFKTQQKINFHK